MPIYLKLGTVRGESKAKQHEGWIELDSFSLGETRTIKEDPFDTSGEVSCARRADSVSVALRRLLASAQPQEATVDFVNQHGEIYMQLMLSKVLIASHSFSGAASDGPPVETFTLYYSTMTMVRFSVNSDNDGAGKLGSAIAESYRRSKGIRAGRQ